LGGAAGGAGNDAVGECFDDSVFDEFVTINDATPDNIKLTASSVERHDGIAGTGVRNIKTGTGGGSVFSLDVINITIEFMEVDGSSNNRTATFRGIRVSTSSSTRCIIKNCIVHDFATTNSANMYGILDDTGAMTCVNNIIYDIVNSQSGGASEAIGILTSGSTNDVMGNTVHNTTKNVGTLPAFGIKNSSAGTFKNNVVTDTGGSGSGPNRDYKNTDGTQDFNLSSDTSANGASSLISKSAANQYVSTTGGSEDLHLKAGADAIGAGVDLVATPTGVNNDINDFDRNGLASIVWDMGAHQYKILSEIGTTGRDFTTITLWEAAMSTTSGSADSLSQGDVYNDTVFDEIVSFNDTTPGEILLTVPSAERHDGTAGTGARNVRTGSGIVFFVTIPNFTAEWLEIDDNANGSENGIILDQRTGADRSLINVYRNMIIHDNLNDKAAGITVNNGACNILNTIVYDMKGTHTGGSAVEGIAPTSDRVQNIMNCTVYNTVNDNGSGTCRGITTADNSDQKVQNCIVIDTLGTTSASVEDFDLPTPANAVYDHNISTDSTASGTGSLTGITAVATFVSLVGDSEDLHLLDTSVAIGAGSVIGSTPAGVDIDIDGTTRGATWDIGADENVLDTPVVAAVTANRRTRTLFLFAN